MSYGIVKTSKAKILRKGADVYLSTKLEELDGAVMSISKW